MSGATPNPDEPRPRHPRLVPQLLVFLAFLSLWTWKLLEPIPVPPEVTGGLSREVKFALAKTLHVCGYAFLTLLAATLPVAHRWHIFLVVLLLVHGIASEIGQSFIPNRTCKTTDVLLDWFGIVLGVVAVQWWRRR